MKILVTGADGMLGKDLCPMLEDNDYEITETDINMLDITNEIQTRSIITQERPDFVIHCAAYTNVDKAEEEKEISEKVNVTGASNVAKACKSAGSSMIYISTDYVFDGTKKTPYEPEDKPCPLNQYGLTKLKGEEEVLKHCPNSYIARTSWLYGHHGKNFVETMLSLSDKDLKVVNDQTGCPTWTVDLCDAIIDLIEEAPEYGIYHLCGSGETTWYGFAQEIFKQSGHNANLTPCMTDDYQRLAKRPKYSVLNNNGCLRNWKLALKDYLELRFD